MLDDFAVKTAAHAVKLGRNDIGFAEEGLNAVFRKHIVLRTENHAELILKARNKFRRNMADIQPAQVGIRFAEFDHIVLL